MGTPKEDPEDEIPHENLVQGQDPDPDTRGSDLGIARGDVTLSSLTEKNPEEKGVESDSKEQATKSVEKEGLAITAHVNPTNEDRSSPSNHIKVNPLAKEANEDSPNSSPNMRVKFVVGSNSLPQIRTPNALLPSPQSNREKFNVSIISEKSLDKLQPRRNPEISIRFTPPSATPEKPLEDGFNWRKYGQKVVKGNGFVRSYYRCTHHNCVVKKQVERSNAGQLTDINYIGEHEHPRPQHIPQAIAVVQPSQMRKPELSIVSSPEGSTNFQPLAMRKPELSVASSPQGMKNVHPLAMIVSSPKAEKSSASHCVVPQFDESKSSAPPPAGEDSVRSFTGEEVDNTPDWKRRKICISSSDGPVLIKHSSEPRQVVQTMSEVDLVNDGYRWRKYGQKLVKGNLNPRSYYRCSSASGCPAKKHIERSSHDHKVVITTYEGQHNHEMPFTRGVAQNTSGGRGIAAVIGESRSSETGEKTNGLEMVLHIGAS